MPRANFSQRRNLDGPWTTGGWRDYIKARRDVAVAMAAGALGVAVLISCVIWLS